MLQLRFTESPPGMYHNLVVHLRESHVECLSLRFYSLLLDFAYAFLRLAQVAYETIVKLINIKNAQKKGNRHLNTVNNHFTWSLGEPLTAFPVRGPVGLTSPIFPGTFWADMAKPP